MPLLNISILFLIGPSLYLLGTQRYSIIMESKKKGSAKKKTVQIEEETGATDALVDRIKKRATVTTHGIDNVQRKFLNNSIGSYIRASSKLLGHYRTPRQGLSKRLH